MKRLAAIFIALSIILVITGCEPSLASDATLTDAVSDTNDKVDYVSSSDLSVPSVTETISVTAAKNEDNPIGQDDSKYQLIGAYLNDENEVCVDFSSLSKYEDYDLFRKYFFGVWDSPDGYLPWSLTIDDSENINFAGLGYYGEFYQPSDHVIAFTLLTNGDANVLWLDMANPDVMYMAVFLMTNGLGVFTIEGVTSDVHELAKNDAAPNMPTDGFLSIFKLHEMARNYDIDFDLLTNIDYGFMDGKHILHSTTYDFYPMYLVSEADDKIEIRTSAGNFGETDLEPINVLCTFEKEDGEWVRTVEFDDADSVPIEITNEDVNDCLSIINENSDFTAIDSDIYDIDFDGSDEVLVLADVPFRAICVFKKENGKMVQTDNIGMGALADVESLKLHTYSNEDEQYSYFIFHFDNGGVMKCDVLAAIKQVNDSYNIEYLLSFGTLNYTDISEPFTKEFYRIGWNKNDVAMDGDYNDISKEEFLKVYEKYKELENID